MKKLLLLAVVLVAMTGVSLAAQPHKPAHHPHHPVRHHHVHHHAAHHHPAHH